MNRLVLVLFAVALLTVSAVAHAQPKVQLMNELAPFAAFVAGGEPDPSGAFGITYSRFLNTEQAIDVTVLVQPTTVKTEEGSVRPEVDFDIEYYHVGGRYTPILQNSRVRPYVSMSLGMSRFVATPGDEEAGFSVGFGGGTDLPLSPRIAVRFDARLFTTIALSNAQIYCEPGTCTSFVTGSTFVQFAGSAGLVFKF